MTKKEIKSAINKAVYQYAETLGYQMDDQGGDGSLVTFYKPNKPGKDAIDYHRSYHQTYVLNWASDECKKDAELIEEFAKQQQLNYQQ